MRVKLDSKRALIGGAMSICGVIIERHLIYCQNADRNWTLHLRRLVSTAVV